MVKFYIRHCSHTGDLKASNLFTHLAIFKKGQLGGGGTSL